MFNQVVINDEIKIFVQELLSEKLFDSTAEIKYFPGSEIGDGYGSKTVGVDVTDKTKSLHLFLKCALTTTDQESFHEIYATEIEWYKTIYPEYQKFLVDKNVKNGFRNVPKSYGVLEKIGSETVALENLRARDFTLFDRSKLMNHEHLKLTLETFAKFHAISFALKDQRRKLHDDFIRGRPNIIVALKDLAFDKVISNMVNEFVSKLDPVEDKDLLERSDNLAARIVDQVVGMERYLTDYSILTKGDCWVNNMMILYKDGNKEHPMDVMLIDWQGITRGSPVHDFGGVFLSVSSEETLKNFDLYISLYYEELSKRIRELGSDPDQVYPFEILKNDWKKYGLYCFGIAIVCVKMMLVEKENVPLLEQASDTDIKELAEATERAFKKVTDNEEQVMKRLKYITRHLIKIGAL